MRNSPATLAFPAALTLAFLASACKSGGDEVKPAGPTSEPPPGQATPDERAAQEEAGDDNIAACPEAVEYDAVCSQQVVWARDPESSLCCEYPTPCAAPEGWEQLSSENDCRAAM